MRILKNQTYTGTYTSNKTTTEKDDRGKSVRVLKDESDWVIIPCDRLVDDETFALAQELIKKGKILH